LVDPRILRQRPLGFLDDSHPADELVAGVPVLGALSRAWEFKPLPYSERSPARDRCVQAIGHPALRQLKEQVLEALSAPLGGVVHHCACVSPSAQLAPGCVVLAGSVVNADAQLERGGAWAYPESVDRFQGSTVVSVRVLMACCSYSIGLR